MWAFISFQLISLDRWFCRVLNLPMGINYTPASLPPLDLEYALGEGHFLPLLAEFFIDGLGSLLVGSCPEVVIGHQVRSPMADPELAILEKTYSAFRTNTNDQVQFKLALHYFKNHLQCST